MDSSALAARHDGGAYGELHPFEHARDQHPGQEIGVHSGGFQARPETGAGDGAVGAGGDSQFRVLKFGRDGAEQAGRDTNIAVAHHHQVVCGFANHAVQTVDFGVGIRRLARDEDAAGYPRMLLAQFFDYGERGVVCLRAAKRISKFG